MNDSTKTTLGDNPTTRPGEVLSPSTTESQNTAVQISQILNSNAQCLSLPDGWSLIANGGTLSMANGSEVKEIQPIDPKFGRLSVVWSGDGFYLGMKMERDNFHTHRVIHLDDNGCILGADDASGAKIAVLSTIMLDGDKPFGSYIHISGVAKKYDDKDIDLILNFDWLNPRHPPTIEDDDDGRYLLLETDDWNNGLYVKVDSGISIFEGITCGPETPPAYFQKNEGGHFQRLNVLLKYGNGRHPENRVGGLLGIHHDTVEKITSNPLINAEGEMFFWDGSRLISEMDMYTNIHNPSIESKGRKVEIAGKSYVGVLIAPPANSEMENYGYIRLFTKDSTGVYCSNDSFCLPGYRWQNDDIKLITLKDVSLPINAKNVPSSAIVLVGKPGGLFMEYGISKVINEDGTPQDTSNLGYDDGTSTMLYGNSAQGLFIDTERIAHRGGVLFLQIAKAFPENDLKLYRNGGKYDGESMSSGTNLVVDAVFSNLSGVACKTDPERGINFITIDGTDYLLCIPDKFILYGPSSHLDFRILIRGSHEECFGGMIPINELAPEIQSKIKKYYTEYYKIRIGNHGTYTTLNSPLSSFIDV